MSHGAPVRWRLVVEYHGGAFVGWQVQPGGRTVQGVLEAAGKALLGHDVHVTGSGRTDSGVHALGQVASFETPVVRSPRAMRDGLNAHLPDDVACVSAEVVPPTFDPRRWTRRKTYRYTWLDRRARSPLRADRAWHVGRALDERAMAEAGLALVGRLDFGAFRAAGCASTHAVRTIEALTVRREHDEVVLEVVGNGFLRHMVRIIAGTLTEVGLGRRSPAWVGEVLLARDRDRAGRTAPAHGLTLVAVEYGEGPPGWHDP